MSILQRLRQVSGHALSVMLAGVLLVGCASTPAPPVAVAAPDRDSLRASVKGEGIAVIGDGCVYKQTLSPINPLMIVHDYSYAVANMLAARSAEALASSGLKRRSMLRGASICAALEPGRELRLVKSIHGDSEGDRAFPLTFSYVDPEFATALKALYATLAKTPDGYNFLSYQPKFYNQLRGRPLVAEGVLQTLRKWVRNRYLLLASGEARTESYGFQINKGREGDFYNGKMTAPTGANGADWTFPNGPRIDSYYVFLIDLRTNRLTWTNTSDDASISGIQQALSYIS